MRTFYISIWILVALAAAVLFLIGYFDPLMGVVFSLLALALVFAPPIWSVITNAYDAELRIFSLDDEA